MFGWAVMGSASGPQLLTGSCKKANIAFTAFSQFRLRRVVGVCILTSDEFLLFASAKPGSFKATRRDRFYSPDGGSCFGKGFAVGV